MLCLTMFGKKRLDPRNVYTFLYRHDRLHQYSLMLSYITYVFHKAMPIFASLLSHPTPTLTLHLPAENVANVAPLTHKLEGDI